VKVWVKVKDHGIGIPEAEKNQIFTPYFKSGHLSHIKEE